VENDFKKYKKDFDIEKRIRSLNWWDAVEVDKANSFSCKETNTKITFVPSQHNSGRGGIPNTSLWGGFLIDDGEDLVYHAGMYSTIMNTLLSKLYAGDTGLRDISGTDICPVFDEIRGELGGRQPTLSFIPMGATDPRETFSSVHITPEEMLQIHQILGSRLTVPIHYGTIILTTEPPESLVPRMLKEMEHLDIPANEVVTMEIGQTLSADENFVYLSECREYSAESRLAFLQTRTKQSFAKAHSILG
jgi:L-ascorbate metabolism protein UlaG (beta-lactamase superfamily)